ncbi:hypothetical protein DIPPA_01790 [Diplonema papillatum]|nr:hypothetical protein DIPPA_01790 [Diplonema papillatum]
MAADSLPKLPVVPLGAQAYDVARFASPGQGPVAPATSRSALGSPVGELRRRSLLGKGTTGLGPGCDRMWKRCDRDVQKSWLRGRIAELERTKAEQVGQSPVSPKDRYLTTRAEADRMKCVKEDALDKTCLQNATARREARKQVYDLKVTAAKELNERISKEVVEHRRKLEPVWQWRQRGSNFYSPSSSGGSGSSSRSSVNPWWFFAPPESDQLEAAYCDSLTQSRTAKQPSACVKQPTETFLVISAARVPAASWQRLEATAIHRNRSSPASVADGGVHAAAYAQPNAQAPASLCPPAATRQILFGGYSLTLDFSELIGRIDVVEPAAAQKAQATPPQAADDAKAGGAEWPTTPDNTPGTPRESAPSPRVQHGWLAATGKIGADGLPTKREWELRRRLQVQTTQSGFQPRGRGLSVARFRQLCGSLREQSLEDVSCERDAKLLLADRERRRKKVWASSVTMDDGSSKRAFDLLRATEKVREDAKKRQLLSRSRRAQDRSLRQEFIQQHRTVSSHKKAEISEQRQRAAEQASKELSTRGLADRKRRADLDRQDLALKKDQVSHVRQARTALPAAVDSPASLQLSRGQLFLLSRKQSGARRVAAQKREFQLQKVRDEEQAAAWQNFVVSTVRKPDNSALSSPAVSPRGGDL